MDPAPGRPTEGELVAATFLAIDPGTQNPACALFEAGRVVRAERVKVPRYQELRKLDEGARCQAISELIEAWALRHGGGRISAVVFELPQIYTSNKSKGNPNQLLPLAMIGAGVTMALRPRHVISPQPGEWCKIPKDEDARDPWSTPRGQLIWRRLSVEERLRVEATHDAIDAAGLGLWAIGRLDRLFIGSS